MSRLRTLPLFLNQPCHNRLFGTALIVNGLALVHALSPSNHFYVTLTVISATLRRILSSVLRVFTWSRQMTPHLSLPIVIGSMICMHTLKLHHVSMTTNTNPVTRFWKMLTTFLLLLFLQPSVAPTKFTPLRHVELRTKQ